MIALASTAALLCVSPTVIDGDTLVCDGRTVRLVAINARESWGGCRSEAPCPPRSAHVARQRLQALTRGRLVICRQEGQASFGRIVARCHAGRTDLSCSLVRSGHAAEWPKFGRACVQGRG